MSAITAAAMWQEDNLSIDAHQTILHYMANEFGPPLVVPMKEWVQFGQDHIAPQCSYYETKDKK